MACEDCGEPDTNAILGGVEVCDRCFDRRMSAHTGLPRLPDPPLPIVLTGPDSRPHRLRYRIWRAGVGIEVQLDETGVAVGEGYRFAVLGNNDADIDTLVTEVRSTAETEIGRQYLQRTTDRHRWTVGDADEVAGRFAWSDGSDGSPTTWSSTAGPSAGKTWPGPWSPRTVGASAGDQNRVRDLRADAEIIELHGTGTAAASDDA